MLIFLGGTAGKNPWRGPFTEQLIGLGVAQEAIFNPVVADWNAEAQAREEEAKKNASHLVYYIASPMQEGNPLSAYSMVEATMGLYDMPDRTVVVFDTDGMDGHPLKAMKQTAKILRARFPDAMIYDNVTDAVEGLAHAMRA